MSEMLRNEFRKTDETISQKALNDDGRSKMTESGAMVLFVSLAVSIVVCTAFGLISGKCANKKGYSFGAFFALGFFIPIVGLIVALVIQDKQSHMVDDLVKYKLMLDEGIVTKEEFEQKKKELFSQDDLQKKSTQNASSPCYAVAIVCASISLILSAIKLFVALHFQLAYIGELPLGTFSFAPVLVSSILALVIAARKGAPLPVSIIALALACVSAAACMPSIFVLDIVNASINLVLFACAFAAVIVPLVASSKSKN